MRKRAVRLAIAVTFGATLAVGAAGVSGARTGTPAAFTATVTVDTSGETGGQVNSHYVGLSFESGTLSSGKFDNAGDLARMLKNLGSSVIRFGGASVDKTSYAGVSGPVLAGLARLAKASGWSVLYSENLGTFGPKTTPAVTADARSVSTALGSHLAAIACGNEPELFVSKGVRPAPYTEADYLAEDASCLAAVRAGAPKATLAGPDTYQKTWLAGYTPSAADKIGWLAHHYYALGCPHGSTPAQLASTLLSPAQTAKEVAMFNLAATAAGNARAQLWIDETNTAACGGVSGLSDSYASALWAIDYMLTGAEHGVAGMNFHGGLGYSCKKYTPLCQAGASEYTAQPVYYGMLFTHLLGSGHLLPVSVSTTAPAGGITAFALRPQAGGVRLMVENLTGSPAHVALNAGGDPASATVLHLTGPSLLATSGVRIQGAAVAASGSFTPGKPDTVSCSAGSCPVAVAPYTAVLVTIGPTPDVFGTTVTVHTSGKTAGQINSHYIGLSFESAALRGGSFDNVGDLTRMLKNLGSSVMRFGGNSVDRATYTPPSASALAGLARLARASGWTVLYSEALGTFGPKTAGAVTADARRVSTALGTRLAALACGNEPDLYHKNGVRPASYTEADYLAEAAACLAAIRAGAPGVTLAGPDTAGAAWLPGYAAAEKGKVGWLDQHYYPLGCPKGQTPAALASTLLSPAERNKQAAFLATAAAAASTAHARLRISETNSAACGGVTGLSDSYASALWVVQYLLAGAEHSVSGMNFHGGLGTACTGYSPLCQVGAGEYAAQPVYYGMLFTRLLGSGRLLPVTVSTTSPAGNVVAFALRPLTGGGLRLIVENLTKYHTNVALRVGGDPASATVLHLTAPSLLATSGVRIQGAAVTANGSFAPGKPDRVSCSAGDCPVTLAPYTAVLVSVG